MGERVVCPNCGERFKGVGTHWAKSSTCGYPNLSTRHREILDGLLLAGAGGFIRRTENAKLSFVVHSTNEALLEWLGNQFGVIGKQVREAATADETAEQLAGLRAEAGGDTATDYNSKALYRWETRTLPAFEYVQATWRDDAGSPRLPSDFEPSALSFAVLYVMRGYPEQTNTRPPSQAVGFYRAGRAVGTTEEWRQMFDRFSPVVWGSDERVVLRASGEFMQYIEAVEDSPLQVLSSSIRDGGALSTIGSEEEQCGSCGSYFKSLRGHWERSECSPTR